ncbi:DUF1622 domain-containing protein [Myxococcus virescens]|uniref:Uncharacterized membrane protein n=1 Tax=Myxococcus virescens TaxID=83456 RepID=A0A511HAR4_9BACT|nr:DUF1622 domain-containing protein [Myxococcus virescens]GEL70514.1 hypothetical protein MVI01_22980 [Myxococcus virescens]SDD74425.1 Uncharacterized membrane protein [Myxococcus virescens]
MEVHSLISLAAQLMEWAGVGSMVLGAVLALVVLATRQQLPAGEAYRRFRLNLGRAILLGLEFLVAADIIRTVSQRPTLNGVLVLGLIVLIRTFLSFTLTVELEGRWPWQHREDIAGPAHPPPTSSTPQHPVPPAPDAPRPVKH